MKKNLILLFLLIILISCKENSNCTINFYISGKVTDINGNSLSDIEVYTIDDYGGGSTKWANTDTDGKYTFFRGSYSTLGNEYVFFKKAGYKDSITPAIGKGTEACGDQLITRDALMESL